MTKSVLKRIADGDRSAVQECLNVYGRLVWSLARRLSPNQADAEDAVQEIFVDLWRNAGRFDEEKASETTFIAMIARRRLIDRLRKSNRQVVTDSVEDVLSEPANREDISIQQSVEARQAAQALQTLRPEQQKVLQLSIMHGLTYQEISDALTMPLGTVKTNARRGLIQLRENLGLTTNNKSKEVTV